jgi:serine/threonine protein kinase
MHQVGVGGYGKVYKAKSAQNQHELVGFPLTAVRELKLLRSLDKNYTVKLVDVATSESSIYLVFEYLPWDLAGIVLHPHTNLSHSQIKCILRQIITCTRYLHQEANVVHRDIKGSNFLMDQSGTLKLTDFGLAKRLSPSCAYHFQPENSKTSELEKCLTNRVITIWYPPPELLFGSTEYAYEVDMWGIGCIFGELYLQRPPFTGSCELS